MAAASSSSAMSRLSDLSLASGKARRKVRPARRVQARRERAHAVLPGPDEPARANGRAVAGGAPPSRRGLSAHPRAEVLEVLFSTRSRCVPRVVRRPGRS